MKTTQLMLLSVVTFASAALGVDPPPDGGYPNQNTAEGEDTLFSLTSGSGNTALGFQALYSNANAINNTAIGSTTLFSNTTGFDNTAVGYGALPSNTTGYLNTASGSYALQDNTTGFQNTATGNGALAGNTIGSYNTATGNGAFVYNTTGNFNTASGYNALLYNTTGGNNIALGATAGINLTTGSYNIDIGNRGFHGDASTIRIGKQGTQTATYIAAISGVTVPAGVGVIIDPNGHLGTVVSSARYKEAVKPMDKASEAILALEPVTFRYKKALDPDAIPQFGLVAEQVEKVNPDLVARDEAGKPYTVRYEAVNAMLLNEFLKEHRKVEEQSSQIAKQECEVQKLEATVVQL
jgi:endosialidase-like protein